MQENMVEAHTSLDVYSKDHNRVSLQLTTCGGNLALIISIGFVEDDGYRRQHGGLTPLHRSA